MALVWYSSKVQEEQLEQEQEQEVTCPICSHDAIFPAIFIHLFVLVIKSKLLRAIR